MNLRNIGDYNRYIYFLFVITYFFFVPACLCGSYSVSGKIHDSDGKALSDVNIEVYDAMHIEDLTEGRGQLITKSKSNIHGKFSINLERGRYSIIFTKEGYQLVQKDIEFIHKFKIGLGSLILEKSISLNVPGIERKVYSGQQIDLPFELHNYNENSERVFLSVHSRHNIMEVEILDEIGSVSAIIIDPASSKKMILRVNVPMECYQDDQIHLYINNSNVSQVQKIDLEVVPMMNPLLSCYVSHKIIVPEEVVVFNIVIDNPFYFDLPVNLSCVNVPLGWECDFRTEMERGIGELLVPKGEHVDVLLYIKVPYDSIQRTHMFDVQLHANNYSERHGMKLHIESKLKNIQITTKYPSKSIEIGESILYDLVINNPLETPEHCYLSINSIPELWTYKYKNQENQEIQSLIINGNESDTVVLEITPDIASVPNMYEISPLVHSNRLMGVLNLNINLHSNVDIETTIMPLFVPLNQDGNNVVNIRIENVGFTAINDLILNVESSNNFLDFTVNPETKLLLKPGEIINLDLNIRTLDGCPTGDYFVDIIPGGNNKFFEKGQIRVSIKPDRTLFGLGGLVILLVLVLIIYFTKRYNRV